MKWLLAILLILLVVLQIQLWFGDHSLPEAWRLASEVAAQKQENAKLRERNAMLEAEVRDLKQGMSAIEERARTELGMVQEGETFYQVVEPAKEDEAASDTSVTEPPPDAAP